MSANILFFGDVMMGENIDHISRGIPSLYHPDYNLIAPGINNGVIKQADALFYNFEYSLFNKQLQEEFEYTSKIYRGYSESLNLFPRDKIKIVSVANNHFSQHQMDSSIYTKNILKSNGFIVIGSNNKPTELKIKNSKIQFWGVSLVEDKLYCQQYFLSNYDNLLSDLYINDKKDSKWIISIHWGHEYISDASAAQIKLGHSLIDLGFDMVIGHHPHVIQPIEYYNQGIICYSLGNFIFDQNFSFKTRKGLCISTSIEKKIIINQIYYTYQEKYKVRKIKKANKIIKRVRSPKLYCIKLSINKIIMRFLMKLEILFHFNNISKDTFNHYKSRIREIL
jgi:poly-gamma-glutamate synthesis protein (capsule biosynthesis protein)